MPAAADLTIYGGDLTIKIDWSVDAANNSMDDADTTEIEVMISDLVDSDGMGWTDSDGMEDTADELSHRSPLAVMQGRSKSITFVSQDGRSRWLV